MPSCLPSVCSCDVRYGGWNCSTDCSGECYKEPCPTGPRGYTITDLGTLGGWSSRAYAINDRGQVVGLAYTARGDQHAFLWQDGVMTDIHSPPSSSWSSGKDINNAGQVLIHYGFDSLVWDNGVLRPIVGFNLARDAEARAINDAGQVVGYSYDSTLGYSTGFLWQDGVTSHLGLPIGPEDINNLGQIAGSTGLAPSGTQAAVWDGEQIIDLGTLGGLLAWAVSLNDLGQVIGVSERAPGGDRVFYAFLWQDGVMTDSSALAGALVWNATDINNCGEVLAGGWIYHPDYGFLILRDLIPAELRWYGLYGASLNDAGQIAGVGNPRGPDGGPAIGGAFLLDPVPGDLAPDGAVDLRDFRIFQNRFSGASPPASGCLRGDLDGDADVDLADFRLFGGLLTAPR